MKPFVSLVVVYFVWSVTSKTSMQKSHQKRPADSFTDQREASLTKTDLPPPRIIGPLTAGQFHLTEDSKRCLHCHTVNRRKICMVCCSQCRLKAHASCVGLTRASAAALPRWTCQQCLQVSSPYEDSPEPSEQTASVESVEVLAELISKWRTRIPVIQIIPKGARICVADALADTFRRVRTERTLAAWTRYFDFRLFVCASP